MKSISSTPAATPTDNIYTRSVILKYRHITSSIVKEAKKKLGTAITDEVLNPVDT